MLKKAGFRFLGDDEEDAFEFCQKVAGHRAAADQGESYDFGSEALFWEVKRAFRSDPKLALTIQAACGGAALLPFRRGLAQDLRLLKAKVPVRSVLKEIQDRGKRVIKAAADDSHPALRGYTEQLAACAEDVAQSSRVGLDTESKRVPRLLREGLPAPDRDPRRATGRWTRSRSGFRR